MTVSIEIRNCNNQVIIAESGAATDVPSIGGTFIDPDLDTWHPTSNWACEQVTMTVSQKAGCSGGKIRVSKETSEFGVYVCGFKLEDCNGDCVILGCL